MENALQREQSTLLLAQHLVPPLRQHHDDEKKIVIIGGSTGYAGSPYFPALCALRVGIDQVHIICEKEVETAISSFSPEICVHGFLDNPQFSKLITDWMDCGAFVIGPGLGNKSSVLANVTKLLQMLKKSEKPLIICSDGIAPILKAGHLMEGYKHAIIIIDSKQFDHSYPHEPSTAKSEKLTVNYKMMQGVALLDMNATIVRIDKHDFIFNKNVENVCSEPVNQKIIDGRGEILSGVLGAFFLWGCLRETEADLTTIAVTTCYVACKLLRECNVRAFKKHGRALSKMNIIEEIGKAFFDLCGAQ